MGTLQLHCKDQEGERDWNEPGCVIDRRPLHAHPLAAHRRFGAAAPAAMHPRCPRGAPPWEKKEMRKRCSVQRGEGRERQGGDSTAGKRERVGPMILVQPIVSQLCEAHGLSLQMVR